MLRDFENAKTVDVYACGTTTTERIAKRIARGDSGHRVGLGRCTRGGSACGTCRRGGSNSGAGF